MQYKVDNEERKKKKQERLFASLQQNDPDDGSVGTIQSAESPEKKSPARRKKVRYDVKFADLRSEC